MRFVAQKSSPRYWYPRSQLGVTLIELMIALVIGLLATGAMLKVYVDSSQLYRFNESLARIQENGRLGLEFIRREARMVGFWGCYNGTTDLTELYRKRAVGSLAGTNLTLGSENISIGRITMNPSFGPMGFHLTDTIQFQGATGRAATLTSDMEAVNSPITIDDIRNIKPGDALLITDCETAEIFGLSAISGSTSTPTLEYFSGIGVDNSDELSKAYAAGSQIYRVTKTTFCIAKDTDLGQSSLRRLVNGVPSDGTTEGDELVDGIEDMQILVGEDTDADSEGVGGDGIANRYFYVDDSSTDRDQSLTRLVSLRISLLAVSPNNNTTTEPAPYFFNGQEVTPSDRYLRKVFTTTIAVRNKTK